MCFMPNPTRNIQFNKSRFHILFLGQKIDCYKNVKTKLLNKRIYFVPDKTMINQKQDFTADIVDMIDHYQTEHVM